MGKAFGPRLVEHPTLTRCFAWSPNAFANSLPPTPSNHPSEHPLTPFQCSLGNVPPQWEDSKRHVRGLRWAPETHRIYFVGQLNTALYCRQRPSRQDRPSCVGHAPHLCCAHSQLRGKRLGGLLGGLEGEGGRTTTSAAFFVFPGISVHTPLQPPTAPRPLPPTSCDP